MLNVNIQVKYRKTIHISIQSRKRKNIYVLLWFLIIHYWCCWFHSLFTTTHHARQRPVLRSTKSHQTDFPWSFHSQLTFSLFFKELDRTKMMVVNIKKHTTRTLVITVFSLPYPCSCGFCWWSQWYRMLLCCGDQPPLLECQKQLLFFCYWVDVVVVSNCTHCFECCFYMYLSARYLHICVHSYITSSLKHTTSFVLFLYLSSNQLDIIMLNSFLSVFCSFKTSCLSSLCSLSQLAEFWCAKVSYC